MSSELLFPFLGLLLIALGWPLAQRRVRPNRWYGLRVPATFADQSVWYDANAATGRDMIILGTTVTVIALALPRMLQLRDEIYIAVCAGVLGLGSFLLAVRGWRQANRLLRERQARTSATEGRS